MRSNRLAVVAGFSATLAATACAPAPAGEPRASPSESAGAPPAGTSDFVAPPFDAAALRRGLPPGTEIRLRIAAVGKPVVIEDWQFTAADANGCTIHTNVYKEDGTTLVEDQGSATSTWTELEGHAHFPSALTTRKDASIDVAAGHFDTWFFEVRPAEPGGPTKRFHFAKTLPGPPVWMEIVQGDQRLLTMELVSRK